MVGRCKYTIDASVHRKEKKSHVDWFLAIYVILSSGLSPEEGSACISDSLIPYAVRSIDVINEH